MHRGLDTYVGPGRTGGQRAPEPRPNYDRWQLTGALLNDRKVPRWLAAGIIAGATAVFLFFSLTDWVDEQIRAGVGFVFFVITAVVGLAEVLRDPKPLGYVGALLGALGAAVTGPEATIDAMESDAWMALIIFVSVAGLALIVVLVANFFFRRSTLPSSPHLGRKIGADKPPEDKGDGQSYAESGEKK